MSSKFKRRESKEPNAPEEAKPKPKRDLSGMLPRTPNAVTHGGYHLAEQHATCLLDMRTKEGRMLKEFERGIVKELGVCSATQRALLNRASELLLIISAMSQHVAKTKIMKDGELVKCLRSSFISYTNAFRRTLRSIHELRSDPPPGLGAPVQITVRLIDDYDEPMDTFRQPAIEMKRVGESDKNDSGKGKAEDEKA